MQITCKWLFSYTHALDKQIVQVNAMIKTTFEKDYFNQMLMQ